MGDHVDNRIEFDAQTAAAGAVMDWLDADEYRAFIGCTPAMVAQIAVNAYRRSREQACSITTVEQLDTLPDRAVILTETSQDGDPWVWEHVSGDGANDWYTTGLDCPGDPELPALLIWHPDWSQS